MKAARICAYARTVGTLSGGNRQVTGSKLANKLACVVA